MIFQFATSLRSVPNHGVDDLPIDLWCEWWFSTAMLNCQRVYVFLVPSETRWNMDRVTDNYFSLSAWKMILLWKMAQLMGSSLNFGANRYCYCTRHGAKTQAPDMWFSEQRIRPQDIFSETIETRDPAFFLRSNLEVEKIPVIKELCPNMPAWSMATWRTARRFLGWRNIWG